MYIGCMIRMETNIFEFMFILYFYYYFVRTFIFSLYYFVNFPIVYTCYIASNTWILFLLLQLKEVSRKIRNLVTNIFFLSNGLCFLETISCLTNKINFNVLIVNFGSLIFIAYHFLSYNVIFQKTLYFWNTLNWITARKHEP